MTTWNASLRLFLQLSFVGAAVSSNAAAQATSLDLPIAISGTVLGEGEALAEPKTRQISAQQELRPPDLEMRSRTWDLASDTWVATDALGRAVPTHDQVGSPRADKTVGIFYFLWLGRHGDQGPFDISRILQQEPLAMNRPESPLWGPLHAPHHWGESIFGYYVSDDEAVLRKHAQMLSDAGVDMVLFDVTNQLTYPVSWQALGRVWNQMRQQGNHVPQFAFLCPFWAPDKVVNELWEQLYGPGLYPELWFRWAGKPLILADPALLGPRVVIDRRDRAVELQAQQTLGQSFTVDQPFRAVGAALATWATTDSAVTLELHRDGPDGPLLSQMRCEAVVDNGWQILELADPLPAGRYYLEICRPAGRIGWWSAEADRFPQGSAYRNGEPATGDRALQILLSDDQQQQIRQFFTFRKPQPDYFRGPTGPSQWGWLEVYPQHVFYSETGQAEQVTVGVAQNAVDGHLSVLSHPRSHGRSYEVGRPQREPDATGRNFAQQWQRALDIDPAFIFITGWNEWIAGRFDQTASFYEPGPVTFVDQFNPEFSRDIEPMRGGHADNYYYQMVANIRRYKGARPIPPVQSREIVVDGRFEDWQDVSPEYRDTRGDPVNRDHKGWGKELRYVNTSGRNDLELAKVSLGSQSLFFYLRTREARQPPDRLDGTLLLIDLDSRADTGWLGYDLIVNHQPGDDGSLLLQWNQDGQNAWGQATPVAWRSAGKELELAIPRSDLKLDRMPFQIDFKWVDHLPQIDSWADFTLHGDVAPNDRFNFRAIFSADP